MACLIARVYPGFPYPLDNMDVQEFIEVATRAAKDGNGNYR